MVRLRPKEHWGKYLWGFLHTISICDFDSSETNFRIQEPIKNNIKMLTDSIPCNSCKDHFIKKLSSIDILDLNKSNVLFYWTVDLHNEINKKIGKKEISYSEAINIWCNKIDG
jgi:hypothetical protein